MRQQLHDNDDTSNLEPVNTATARIKTVGAQWLVKLNEYICDTPTLIVNGFLASGITHQGEHLVECFQKHCPNSHY